MTTVIPSAGIPAPAPVLKSLRSLDQIQLHAQAANALAMALHYVRQPSSNVPGATRKAVQALAALNLMHAANRGREAANDGRA